MVAPGYVARGRSLPVGLWRALTPRSARARDSETFARRAPAVAGEGPPVSAHVAPEETGHRPA